MSTDNGQPLNEWDWQVSVGTVATPEFEVLQQALQEIMARDARLGPNPDRAAYKAADTPRSHRAFAIRHQYVNALVAMCCGQGDAEWDKITRLSHAEQLTLFKHFMYRVQWRAMPNDVPEDPLPEPVRQQVETPCGNRSIDELDNG